jgi:hypothetical protein
VPGGVDTPEPPPPPVAFNVENNENEPLLPNPLYAPPFPPTPTTTVTIESGVTVNEVLLIYPPEPPPPELAPPPLPPPPPPPPPTTSVLIFVTPNGIANVVVPVEFHITIVCVPNVAVQQPPVEVHVRADAEPIKSKERSNRMIYLFTTRVISEDYTFI